MARITPFGVLSACHGARHGEIAVAMAAEFGTVDADAVDDALDVLSVGLAAARSRDVASELLGAGEHLDGLLSVDLSPTRCDNDDLLLPPVLTAGTGHELALVQAAAEASRRAGIDVGVVASRDHVYLAHRGGAEGVVLSPRHEWRAIEASDLEEGDLAWRCSHEVSYLVLGEILRRTEHTGVLPVALRASELRMKLPLEHRVLDRLKVEHARLRARLN